MDITKKKNQEQKAKHLTSEKAEEIKEIVEDLRITFEDLRIGLDRLWTFILENK